MSKTSLLAEKFAMKLGLEPRPSSPHSINLDLKEEPESGSFEPWDGEYFPTVSDEASGHITRIRVLMHNLSKEISLSDYNNAISTINKAAISLNNLRTLIKDKQALDNMRNR